MKSLSFKVIMALSFGFNVAHGALTAAEKKDWNQKLATCHNDCREVAQSLLQEYSKLYRGSLVRIHLNAKESYLYLHSYMMSPVEDGFQDLIEPNQNINFFAPILTAHHIGSTPDDFSRVSADDWIADADLYLRMIHALGPKVIVKGFSLGGLLATYLAVAHPEKISKLILVAPALMMAYQADDMMCLSDKSFLKSLTNLFVSQGERAEYEKFLNGLCSLAQTMAQVRNRHPLDLKMIDDPYTFPRRMTRAEGYYEQIKKLAEDVTIPTLLVYSEKDESVDVPALQLFSRHLRNKRNVIYPRSQNIDHKRSVFNWKAQGLKQSPWSIMNDFIKNSPLNDELL